MEYNPNIDYRSLHLEWIKKHKSFKPKGGLTLDVKTGRSTWNTYYEQMEAMYRDCYKLHKTAYILLKDDIKHFNVDEDIDDKVNTILGLTPTEKYFITFNFNDDNFDLDKIMPAFERLRDKSYINKMDAVFEYHGSKSNHPHIHMILEVSGPDRTYGRFKKLLTRTQLYKLLAADNFFDIKKFIADRHEDYVDGNKKEDKIKLVELDKEWRAKLNLLDIYTKG